MDLKLSVTKLDQDQNSTGYRMVPLYDDADVEISMLIASEHGQEYISLPAPAHKCYQSGTEIPSWQNQRRSTLWAMIQPLVFVIPKTPIRPGEMYDFCVRGYLAHGGNISDEYTNSVSPIKLRRERPELEAFFEHPALQSLFASCASIGLHHPHEKFNSRRIFSHSLLTQKVKDWTDDLALHLFTTECFYRVNALINMSGDSHRQQQLPHFLSRDIKDGIRLVLNSIAEISDEDFDIPGHRRAGIVSAVKNLVINGRTINMVRRLDGNAEVVITTTLVLMISDYIASMVDHSIGLSR
jgi:hypothetical protein